MKTFMNKMMAMSAVVMMMAASFNTATATEKGWKMVKTDPEPSEMSQMEAAPASRIMQYYYVNGKNESRRFVYSVDAEGRVTDRIMYGWDNEHQTWFPMTLTHAKYGSETNSLTHAVWNAKTKHFENKESQSYSAADFTGTMIHLPAYACER